MRIIGRRLPSFEWFISMVQPSPDKERIRKVVGMRPDTKNPVRRVWELRVRMLRLGIDFGNDDERIRKVVGGPQRGDR